MSSVALSSKLPYVGESIFSTMSALAKKHNAINLSQGFPDFEVDPKLLDLATYYLKKGFNQYAPMPGIISLRKVIASFYQKPYSVDTEICVTQGATQAIATAIGCTVNFGDEVILFAPAYDCYAPMILANGAKPVFVNLSFPNFSINWQEVSSKISSKTKLIIINSPHNPSGRVLSVDELLQLQALCERHNILVLSDEVYQHIVFAPAKHHSVANFEALRNRSFIVGSFGKSLHITGWKIGYCVAPEALMAEFKKLHQYMVFSVNHALQHAIAAYLKALNLDEIALGYAKKQALFLTGVKASKFTPLTCQGSYFQLLSYEDISAKNDVEFARDLTENAGVASIPLSGFYHPPQQNKVLRFCFAKADKTLQAATKKLCEVT